jgi:hypothetical protein
MSWNKLCLPKIHIKVLTPKVTVFGDRAVKGSPKN